MYKAISDSLHKELKKKDDFDKIDLSKGKFNQTVEIRNKLNNKINFLINLRKAVNKKEK